MPDNAGTHTLSAVRRALAAEGTLVYNSGAPVRRIALAMLLSRMGQKVFTFLAKLNRDDLEVIRALIESGKVRSIIDRTFPLQEVAAAIAYVEAGHVRVQDGVTPALAPSPAAPSSTAGSSRLLACSGPSGRR